MKHFKKLTLIVTTAMLFCLTTADSTGSLIVNQFVTVDEQTDAKESTAIRPLSDQDDENKNKKRF